jgi:hypothetical protein
MPVEFEFLIALPLFLFVVPPLLFRASSSVKLEQRPETRKALAFVH